MEQVETREQWTRDIALRDASRNLALLVMQSDAYHKDMDIRDAVDAVITLTVRQNKP